MNLAAQLKTISHHAYCLIGRQEEKAELVAILEKKHKLAARANPDFFDRTYEIFAIDDARAVKAQAEMRPIHESGKKIFILAMNGITSEAQNALLKLLEEPPEYAHFFLILPSVHLLLPTVKSRLSFLTPSESASGETGTSGASSAAEAAEFMKLAPQKRLDFVKKFMEDISKEKRPKQDAVDLLNAVQEAVHAKGAAKNAQALEAIEISRTYMNDRSPSLKMLLEYVALSV
ncbi:MAG: polymerase subunit delta, polymerase subunit delta protein [Candidatus Parcubacteria bacterium]|nr:polymerase subunit delta, polymerase subunit delta protein [Candidatus Parcubacteria bacterium]